MSRGIKITIGALAALLVFSLLIPLYVGYYWHPDPGTIYARESRKGQRHAEALLEQFQKEFEVIAENRNKLPEDFLYYSYGDGEENADVRLPDAFVTAVEELKQACGDMEFPSFQVCRNYLSIFLYQNGTADSYLCFPAGTLVSDSVDGSAPRCIDMGDGWEVQIYYVPKG